MDFLQARQNIFKNLKPTSLDLLRKNLVKTRTKTRDQVFYEGDVLDRVYFSASGQYALYKLNRAGEKRVIFTLGPGEVLNYPEVDPKPISIGCQVLGPGEVYSLGQKTLVEVMKSDPQLALNCLDLYNLRMRRLYRQLKNSSGYLRLDKRLAAKLWKLSRDYPLDHPLGTAIDLKLSVTLLSQVLGVSRESLSRNSKLLQDLGLLLYKGSQWIIPDRQALENYFKD